ncbi:hypothetical protein A7U60_g1285 [Sanghuangporus baumii]|uniref:Uncharacterized protein n=1 Tax=Sanghuangporus baumii TaxID=108892 RepID=A0A9Q5NBU2_SANBA|nr:hypothetical protein A7U60_g1285 [Sanghuangporus baumii]
MEDAEEVRRRLGFLHFPSLQVLSSRKSEILAFQHPQQTFEVPSLRILDVDFLPHNSMARNLVELHLNLWMVSLASLLDFLSSTSVLEVLNISVLFIDNGAEQEMFDHKPVRQPGLVKLCLGMRGCLISSASIVARKIHSSSLRTLVLRCDDCEVGTTSDGPFQNILQSNPSFTKLELSGFTSIDLCHTPPQVEVLLLDVRGFSYFNCAGTVSSHQIRLIRFHEAEEPLVQDRVYDIRQVLLDSGLNAVQFEFQNCRRFRNGFLNLDDAHRTFLDDGDDDYMDDDFD